MRYDRGLYCLVDVVFWVSVESMCRLSLNGERKGCEGPWMFWPVLTLISGRRRVSCEDNKELQSCRAVPYMIITFVSALAQKTPAHSCLWNAGFSGPQCPEKILVRSRWSMYVGLGFLGLLAVGKTSMMGRWEFLHAGTFGGLWAFLGILLLGNASLWYGLSAWVSSVYGSRSFWACCSTERHDVSGMYDFVEGNWGAKLGLDICSCLTQSRKCSSEETVRTSCAVYAALRSSINDEWRASRWCESSSKSNQKKIYDSKSWTFFIKKKLKELNLFIMTQRIESFFDMTQRIEYFLWKILKNWTFFFCRRLKELNCFFLTKKTTQSIFSRKMTQRIQLFFFFFEHDSKNWSSFFLVWLKDFSKYDSKIFLMWLKKKWFFLNVTRRIEHFLHSL